MPTTKTLCFGQFSAKRGALQIGRFWRIISVFQCFAVWFSLASLHAEFACNEVCNNVVIKIKIQFSVIISVVVNCYVESKTMPTRKKANRKVLRHHAQQYDITHFFCNYQFNACTSEMMQ